MIGQREIGCRNFYTTGIFLALFSPLVCHKNRMALAVINQTFGFLIEPEQTKRDQKQMQDTGVIWVLQIFHLKLPVTIDNLPLIPHDP